MRALGFNTTTGPVVIDGDGRTIGGGEWASFDTLTDEAKAAEAAGELVRVPDPEDSAQLSDAAGAAWAQVQKDRQPAEEPRKTRRTTADKEH